MKKNNITGWLHQVPDLEKAYLEDEISRCNQEAYTTAVLYRLHETKKKRLYYQGLIINQVFDKNKHSPVGE